VSTCLGAHGGGHSIDVEETAAQLESCPRGRFTYRVNFPSLWRPGDYVAILTSDGRRFQATVAAVSGVTRAVLIELN